MFVSILSLMTSGGLLSVLWHYNQSGVKGPLCIFVLLTLTCGSTSRVSDAGADAPSAGVYMRVAQHRGL